MTNEQITHYEALDQLVEHEHDELTNKVMQLAGMRVKRGESASIYLSRVQDASAAVHAQRTCLDTAKANKRAFLMAL